MTEHTISGDLTRRLEAALAQKKPWMLGGLAHTFNVTEKEVALALPAGMCAFTSGSSFTKVWEGLVSWEKATFIMQHGGHVVEVSGRIPPGSFGHGFYNLREGQGLGGHIRADAVSDMAFLSMPFMGLESHSVQFFDAGGGVVFSVYAGRENHRIIPSVKASFLSMKKELADR